MKKTTLFLSSLLLTATMSQPYAASNNAGIVAASGPPIAPYLLPDAPAFDLTLAKFRERFNTDNPALPIDEFRVIKIEHNSPPLTRAASKINEHLYLSAALEKRTGKIKTLQITLLPAKISEEKALRSLAVNYIAALMTQFEPTLSLKQSTVHTLKLLESGEGSRFYTRSVGAIRYVVVNGGEKGLTFAFEPVKLMLADP